MIIHVYSAGSPAHIGKIYKDAGIPARFVTASYLRADDLIGADAVIVDSLISLTALEPLVLDAKLYEGGKPTFKAMMGSSIVTRTVKTKQPIRIMAGMSHKQLYTRTAKIIYHKLLKKITHPEKYVKTSKPNINIAKSDQDMLAYVERRSASLGGKIVLMSLDCETKQEGVITGTCGKSYWIYSVIELVQATVVTQLPDKTYDLFTLVFPFKTLGQYNNIKKICASPYPKVMSNGHYDIEQFLHWRIPVVNFAWDVEYCPRSITADLTGYYSLGNSTAIWCLNVKTWKDLTDFKTDRNESQYKAFLLYSGLDTHYTAATALNQAMAMRGQNLKNYLMKMEFDGLTAFMNLQLLPIEVETQRRLLEDATNMRIDNTRLFKKATGLNPTQNEKVLPLFQTLHFNMRKLGFPDMGRLDSLGEKNLSGLINSHPMWSAAVNIFLDAKHGEKDGATFLQYIKYFQANDLGRERPYFDYAMSQYTTMTLRYASKSSNAWCGGNVQNISGYYRQQYRLPDLTLEPPPPEEDDEEVVVSIDAPQSEARTVGYLSQCLTIIKVLEDPELDYHIFNAANAVFNKPYETITKLQRQLSKAPGFGFFYGQSWHGLMMTLGVKAMRELRDQLGLSKKTPLPAVAKQVSQGIDRLYWEIRKNYYPRVVATYRKTSRIPCITGYAPIAFGDINKGETVRTIVCIDGQHTSAHINMTGGVHMLNGFLFGKSEIERNTYPYLQLHDEIQCRTKARFTVKEFDDYTDILFHNKYRVNGRDLTIPRGVPVFGLSLKDLKDDEIPRTPEVLNLTLREAVLNYSDGKPL
uniref:DNA-directed DNA polymerase n=1 Tax=uncultured Thiotrichaceae bacterium TaxID=298394 RepID=A0A6S6UME6_9GAMM|nr:MAG: Unknown protein [uncultured Thiotrichaceae bacterium]